VSSSDVPSPFSEADLEAYLDESLAPEQAARIEEALADSPELSSQLQDLNGRRNAGRYSVADIWRRGRLSCPTRSHWGSYLLSALDDDEAGYMRFHLEVVGCRYCQANVADLQAQQADSDDTASARRRKYFKSSAGYLDRKAHGEQSQ